MNTISPFTSATPFSRSLFIDRQNDLELIKDQVEALLENQDDHILFVSGTGGLGKTRLLESLTLASLTVDKFINSTFSDAASIRSDFITSINTLKNAKTTLSSQLMLVLDTCEIESVDTDLLNYLELFKYKKLVDLIQTSVGILTTFYAQFVASCTRLYTRVTYKKYYSLCLQIVLPPQAENLVPPHKRIKKIATAQSRINRLPLEDTEVSEKALHVLIFAKLTNSVFARYHTQTWQKKITRFVSYVFQNKKYSYQYNF